MTGFEPLTMFLPTFFAGVLMFLAPCTLPIVPGYMAFIAGVPESAVGVRGARKRIVWNALAFVLGFSVVFILLGVFASFLGTFIGPWRDILGRLGGVVLIIFGLTMLGFVRIPALSSTASVRIPHFVVLGRWESSLLVGMLFAFGWSPCVGPILGSVLTLSLLATGPAAMFQGAMLLAVFSFGLGLPFLITALFLQQASNVLKHLTTFVRVLNLAGGVGLLVVGVLLILGDMGGITAYSLQLFEPLYGPLLQYM